jgi:hypothetical protein
MRPLPYYDPDAPPPPYTHCIRVYCTLIHTGTGGGGGRLEGQQFTKLGLKYQHD